MSDHAIQPAAVRRTDPQRLAWGVLLVAFAIFCAICVVTGVGVNYLLFQWPMPMDAVLSVGRGTVGITGSGNSSYLRNDITTLSQNTNISTDPSSQAVISFLDASADNRVIAVMTVRNNSALSLSRSVRPRFDWSTNGYLIELAEADGQFDVQIMPGIQRPVRMTLLTQQNTLIDLDASGRYIIDVSDAGTSVYNRDGSAKLFLQQFRSGLVIPQGGHGVASGDTVQLAPSYTDLLANGDFRDLNATGTQQLLAGWFCSNGPNDNPRGSYRSQMVEGTMTLRLERFDNATSHGSTSCLQSFGQGLDLSGYSHLALRMRFMIHAQSLSVCGNEGSECPLMLRMDYVDETGEPKIWYHGFYASGESQLELPLRCDSCPQEHESINPRMWYTYDSGNLLNLFPVNQKPISMINLWFYASGHQYDVQVADVALLAAD
jgi:hypothetical protein